MNSPQTSARIPPVSAKLAIVAAAGVVSLVLELVLVALIFTTSTGSVEGWQLAALALVLVGFVVPMGLGVATIVLAARSPRTVWRVLFVLLGVLLAGAPGWPVALGLVWALLLCAAGSAACT